MDGQVAQPFDLRTLRHGYLHDDIDGFVTGLLLNVTHGRATQGHGQVAVDGIHGDTATHRLFRVHVETPVVVGLAQVIVHVHQALRLIEDGGHLAGELTADLRRGAMDLGHHRLEHRGSGRHLDHRDLGARTRHQRQQDLAGLDGQLMTGALTLLLVQELHLDLRLPGVGA